MGWSNQLKLHKLFYTPGIVCSLSRHLASLNVLNLTAKKAFNFCIPESELNTHNKIQTVYTTASARTWTPRHGFKSSQGGMQCAGLRVLSEPLAWRSTRLWQIPPHSTEARRMVPVSAAQSLPTMSSHYVSVHVCLQGGETTGERQTKEIYSLLMIQ